MPLEQWGKLATKALQERSFPRNAKKKISIQALLADLKTCSKMQDLQRGKRVHAEAVACGHDSNIYVLSTLVRMYAKCGSIVQARRVFDSIHKPDVVSWTSLLLGYAENREGLVALHMFSRMKASGCVPNSVTYMAALKACASLAEDGDGRAKKNCLERGRRIHLEIGTDLDLYLQSTLIDMYAKCGSMDDARRVFDTIQKPNVVCWTALLLGYAENGEGSVALDMFCRMKASGCAPNSVTYVAALKACTSLAVDGNAKAKRYYLERGKEIHWGIGSNLDLYIQSTLIDMYAKCGSMVDAHSVFDSMQKPDVVSWTALLLGYAENGEGLVTLDLFSRMKKKCAPNSVTYIAVLKACGLIGALALGRKLHSEMTQVSAQVVTCLVDFYGKCGSMAEAHEVFDLHPKARDIATWNALLAGYSRFGDSNSVFNLFEAMQDQGFRPDAVTFVCMLSCCSHAGLVQKAREYFEGMDVRYGVTPDVMHYSCMVDVLGRANLLNEAIVLLQKMPCYPDAVIWMALLGACRKWKNVEVGKIAFQNLVARDEKVASADVLMAHIHGSTLNGTCVQQVSVMETRPHAYVLNEVGQMVMFVMGEQGPLEVEEKMQQLSKDMKEHGCVADLYSMRCNVSDIGSLCGHSGRRAVVFGILKTPLGEPVRVFKNMRMCDDCHGLLTMVSKLSRRVLMVRDATRFHVMANGTCSCGD